MRTKTLSMLGLILLLVLTAGTGCKKKVQPTAPVAAPPSQPARPAEPTVSLSASPDTIERGQSTTLSWSSTNAHTLTLEPGLGRVPEKGTMSVSPYESMTYRIMAQGAGGSAEASARVSVNPRAEAPAPPRPTETNIPELFAQNVHDIYFDYDKFDIRPDAIPVLQANAEFLRKYSQLTISLEGHCDERGSAEYNLGLGDRRATSAKEYLISLGIDGNRIRTISYGKERPICSEATEECWQRNRRAHFVLNP